MNTWTNEFGDRIIKERGIRISSITYVIVFAGEYLMSRDGLNAAKAELNKKRGVKCKWTESKQ